MRIEMYINQPQLIYILYKCRPITDVHVLLIQDLSTFLLQSMFIKPAISLIYSFILNPLPIYLLLTNLIRGQWQWYECMTLLIVSQNIGVSIFRYWINITCSEHFPLEFYSIHVCVILSDQQYQLCRFQHCCQCIHGHILHMNEQFWQNDWL